MLEERLTKKQRQLYEQLMQIPQDFVQLRKDLAAGCYSPEDIGRAAICYADDCMLEDCEIDDTVYESTDDMYHNAPTETTAGLPSSSAVELLRLLLEYGLDPNAAFDGSSLMALVGHIANGYVGADALTLLLEHGGDPSLEHDGETLFNYLDFDVIFDAIEQYDRRRYDALVHCWFVLLGYGATLKNGSLAVDTFGGFEISRLKNHRDFSFCLSHVPSRGEPWSLHIYEKRTLWEVARL